MKFLVKKKNKKNKTTLLKSKTQQTFYAKTKNTFSQTRSKKQFIKNRNSY